MKTGALTTLPFVPWWHHPNHRYVGKHRGTYQFGGWSISGGRLIQPLPYGVRDIKITPYVGLNEFGQACGSGYKPIGFMIPDHQVIEFTSEPFEGDDTPIMLKGKRDWNISMTVENVNPEVFSILFGDQPCSQQSRCKATLLSVAVRVKRFFKRVIPPFLRREGN